MWALRPGDGWLSTRCYSSRVSTTANAAASADRRFLRILCAWAGAAILTRVVYLLVIEPMLGTSTYVYFPSKSSRSPGFMLETGHWSIYLWAHVAFSVTLTAIAVPLGLWTHKNAAGVAIGGLLLASVSVTGTLGQAVLTLTDARGDVGAGVILFLLYAGAAVALLSIFSTPAKVMKWISARTSRRTTRSRKR